MTNPADHALIEIDCRDLPCPRPIIELARRIEETPVGHRIAVVANDPAAQYDVPAWCRMRGQHFVGADAADDGAPRYVVERRV